MFCHFWQHTQLAPSSPVGPDDNFNPFNCISKYEKSPPPHFYWAIFVVSTGSGANDVQTIARHMPCMLLWLTTADSNIIFAMDWASCTTGDDNIDAHHVLLFDGSFFSAAAFRATETFMILMTAPNVRKIISFDGVMCVRGVCVSGLFMI